MAPPAEGGYDDPCKEMILVTDNESTSSGARDLASRAILKILAINVLIFFAAVALRECF